VKMETANFSLTSLNFYLPNWCHIPQASFLHFSVLFTFSSTKKPLSIPVKYNTLTPPFFFCILAQHSPPPPPWVRASSFKKFLDHTQRRTTVGRTSLEESSAHRRDFYLTTHNTHNRHTYTTPWDSNP